MMSAPCMWQLRRHPIECASGDCLGGSEWAPLSVGTLQCVHMGLWTSFVSNIGVTAVHHHRLLCAAATDRGLSVGPQYRERAASIEADEAAAGALCNKIAMREAYEVGDIEEADYVVFLQGVCA